MGTLRIVAGELRGRRIRVPGGIRVRPTPDKVREALFDILGHDLAGTRVLDACAGSGALGFEALSRGAETATFLEADPKVAELIERNARDLGLSSRCRVVRGRAEALVARGSAGGPFDLVLADPPYAEPVREPLLAALGRQARSTLAPGCRLVFEREAADPPVPDGGADLPLVRTARYGRTCLDFYVFRGA